MPGGWLALAGTQGLLRGEVLLLRPGQEAVLGRGEGSTLPLTHTAAYKVLGARPAALRAACQGVSRRHFLVRVPAEGEVLVENLSGAGTWLDGSRVEAPVHLRDLRDRPHEVRFGRGERMDLRWIEEAPAPAPGAA